MTSGVFDKNAVVTQSRSLENLPDWPLFQ